ncbi:hypothetical protein [Streptomyces prasinopilosus]|uniref:hypothetical protein n=1 Tax=Streptomyces prasinopilosus TaxID=67344 RepID=UPI0006EB4AB8|nr:hypothetical protein [Streptomyces prasinopilosus]
MIPADKKIIRAQLRELRTELNRWTLKAPGLHIDETLVCPTGQGRLRRGTPVLCADGKRGLCEGCVATLYRHDRAEPLRAGIRALDERLNGTTPTPTAAQLPLFA